MYGALNFQFAHPSMRFLLAGARANCQRWPNFANFEYGLCGVGEANWITIIPAIPPIAPLPASSSRFAREYLQDDPRHRINWNTVGLIVHANTTGIRIRRNLTKIKSVHHTKSRLIRIDHVSFSNSFSTFERNCYKRILLGSILPSIHISSIRTRIYRVSLKSDQPTFESRKCF